MKFFREDYLTERMLLLPGFTEFDFNTAQYWIKDEDKNKEIEFFNLMKQHSEEELKKCGLDIIKSFSCDDGRILYYFNRRHETKTFDLYGKIKEALYTLKQIYGDFVINKTLGDIFAWSVWLMSLNLKISCLDTDAANMLYDKINNDPKYFIKSLYKISMLSNGETPDISLKHIKKDFPQAIEEQDWLIHPEKSISHALDGDTVNVSVRIPVVSSFCCNGVNRYSIPQDLSEQMGVNIEEVEIKIM